MINTKDIKEGDYICFLYKGQEKSGFITRLMKGLLGDDFILVDGIAYPVNEITLYNSRCDNTHKRTNPRLHKID